MHAAYVASLELLLFAACSGAQRYAIRLPETASREVKAAASDCTRGVQERCFDTANWLLLSGDRGTALTLLRGECAERHEPSCAQLAIEGSRGKGRALGDFPTFEEVDRVDAE